MKLPIIEAIKATKRLLSLGGRLDNATLIRNGMAPRDEDGRPVRPGPEGNFKFGLGIAFVLSLVILAIALFLAMAVCEAIGATPGNRIVLRIRRSRLNFSGTAASTEGNRGDTARASSDPAADRF